MQYKSFDKLRHTVILLRGLPLRTPPTAKPTITVDFNLYILVVNLINQKFLLTNKKKSDIVNNNSIAEEGVAMTIFEELTKLSDKNYKEFHKKLIPTISSELILGIRTPVLRKFAKEFSKTSMAEEFLRNSHHKYYEENNLHAFLIEGIKDFDKAIYETERFLPYIDNWATCDMFFPKVFAKNPERILSYIYKWIESEHPYTVRYAIGLLMRMFLDEKFSNKYPETVSRVKSDEYYVNMMIAWYFATALAKQYDTVISYITENRLDIWVHNKAIQKALESNRIDRSTKEYLKGFKRKNC